MKDYTINKELILAISDILKSVIPLFAALVASYLTYRFSKKDKIRDHLFTYKVKSYSNVAETILEIKRNMDSVIHDLYFDVISNDYSKSPKQIYTDYNKVVSENTLFISNQTKNDILALDKAINDAMQASILSQIEPERYPKKTLLDLYELVSLECLRFIEKLQSDLEIYRLDNSKKKYWIF